MLLTGYRVCPWTGTVWRPGMGVRPQPQRQCTAAGRQSHAYFPAARRTSSSLGTRSTWRYSDALPNIPISLHMCPSFHPPTHNHRRRFLMRFLFTSDSFSNPPREPGFLPCCSLWKQCPGSTLPIQLCTVNFAARPCLSCASHTSALTDAN